VTESNNAEAQNTAPRRGSAATIYDIAKLSGFNPSTVSRALTTPGRINAKTEAKIKAAAKELNYQVNPFARALPTGRTKMLALIPTRFSSTWCVVPRLPPPKKATHSF
jgi:LacI family transcriptional regulator